MSGDDLKGQVKTFWNRDSCGTLVTTAPKGTRPYYDEIEAYRYRVEPEIFSFAQFTRFHGQKILEVGVGAGSDFLQWVRAGAVAHGIDLTEEGIWHVRKRLELYGLEAADLRVADAENIPHPDESFDLVYSWGVIHHSPDTVKALEEILRVVKVGGKVKLMLYNRRSLWALYMYLLHGPLKGRPFRTVSDVMYHHQESPGTKAYTRREIIAMLDKYPVQVHQISARATAYDLLRNHGWPFRWGAHALACLAGFHRCGWYMTIEFEKTGPFWAAVRP